MITFPVRAENMFVQKTPLLSHRFRPFAGGRTSNIAKWIVVAFVIFFLRVDLSYAEALEEDEDLGGIDKNAVEFIYTSEGFFVGAERVLKMTDKYLFLLDAKNKAQTGDVFGRAGLTYRLGIDDDQVFSSRIEGAWHAGQYNISLKAAYDRKLFGITVTGVMGLSDPGDIESTDLNSVEVSSTVDHIFLFHDDEGYHYDKRTTTTNRVDVKEKWLAAPDGVMGEININAFKVLSILIGGSYWTFEDWHEAGAHGAISWQMTEDDDVGAQVAYVDEKTEAGLFYKRRFSTFRELVRFDSKRTTSDGSLLFRKARDPFGTPMIPILGSYGFNVGVQELRNVITTEEVVSLTPIP